MTEQENRNHPIGDLMGTTMAKLKEMVDANTIIGEAICTGDGITLVPVSRLSFGFASGGTDFNGKNQKPDSANNFGGGSGAAVNIVPVGFLVIKDDSVKWLSVGNPAYSAADRAIEMVPDLVDKVTSYIDKNKKDKETF